MNSNKMNCFIYDRTQYVEIKFNTYVLFLFNFNNQQKMFVYKPLNVEDVITYKCLHFLNCFGFPKTNLQQ